MFFSKIFFFKAARGDNYALEDVSNGTIFLKNVSSTLIMKFFGEKSKKFKGWKT